MTMKAHTYYIIFERPPIGGKLPPLPPWRRHWHLVSCRKTELSVKVFVKAESPAALIGRAESVEGGELLVYSLIDRGNDLFRCQIGVFAASVAECRAIAAAFCSQVITDAG